MDDARDSGLQRQSRDWGLSIGDVVVTRSDKNGNLVLGIGDV